MTKQPQAKIKPQPQAVSPKAPLIIVGVAILICFTVAIVAHATSTEEETTPGDSDNNRKPETKASLVNAFRSGQQFRCLSKKYPLTLGNCNPDVAILQRHLKRLGADLGTTGKQRDGVDGNFGPLTQAAALNHLGKDTFTPQDINTLRK
jgi:hypothetical protein